MNPELCKQALAKVVNPNVLVNIVSRRVRQLNAGGGGSNRPLIANADTMGAADVALTELVEDKMSWEAQDKTLAGDEAKHKKKKKA